MPNIKKVRPVSVVQSMKIVVLGGGVTGLFTSYLLRKDGHSVTLIDTPLDGSRTSAYNAGELTASCVPVPPISTANLLSPYFGRSGPVYVSPAVFMQNLRWFRIARGRLMTGFEDQIMQLAAKSLRMYKEFFAEVSVQVDKIEGITALFTDLDLAKRYAQNLNGEVVDQSEIRQLGYTGFAGGVRFLEELSIHPGKLCDELKRKLTEIGVQIVFEKAQLNKHDGRIDCVKINGVREEADIYVVAAGAWSREIFVSLGYDPLILPARGFVMLFDTGGTRIVGGAGMIEESGISIIQHNANTLRITSFFEMVGFRQSFDESRKRWLLGQAKRHLVNFDKLNLNSVEQGLGFRPCTPDQFPVIGKVPGYENLIIASGNCRLGVTLAPVTGRIVRAIVNGEKPVEIDSKYIDPARFLRYTN